MRKPTYASKKARSATGWWKHARPLGKRMVNKSERKGAKRVLVTGTRSASHSDLVSVFRFVRLEE